MSSKLWNTRHASWKCPIITQRLRRTGLERSVDVSPRRVNQIVQCKLNYQNRFRSIMWLFKSIIPILEFCDFRLLSERTYTTGWATYGLPLFTYFFFHFGELCRYLVPHSRTHYQICLIYTIKGKMGFSKLKRFNVACNDLYNHVNFLVNCSGNYRILI